MVIFTIAWRKSKGKEDGPEWQKEEALISQGFLYFAGRCRT
jgi:hypothetical protein